MKKFIAAALTLLASALPVQANTDLTDLWWNANENGWGVNVIHQGDILFMTFFIYQSNTQPYWLSASAVQFQGNNTQGQAVYSGGLSQTTGPYYGNPTFDPGLVSNFPVGTVTFTVTGTNAATMVYTVQGVAVTKQLTRLTFRNDPGVNGVYLGGVVSDITGCSPPFNNGHFEDDRTLIQFAGTTASTTIGLQGIGIACTITGPYTQTGKIGRVQGNISCSNNVNGTVNVTEIDPSDAGTNAKYAAQYTNGCSEVGRFGGVRR